MKEIKKQEAPALVEFIVFTKIGPMGNARLRTRVFTMKHEILWHRYRGEQKEKGVLNASETASTTPHSRCYMNRDLFTQSY